MNRTPPSYTKKLTPPADELRRLLSLALEVGRAEELFSRQ
jgi:hypothetical protein